jgi:hypothetical protein
VSACHPTWGWGRRAGAEEHVCSKCCKQIPEDHVPLMLFDGREGFWVYCETCEGPVIAMFRRDAPARTACAQARLDGELSVPKDLW